MKKIILIPLLFLLTNVSFGQKKPLILKANSKLVDIRDGENFQKGAWTIVPETKLDIYSTSSNRVTFFTDLDSITIKINQKMETFNFLILVNGKDSAWTQVKYQMSYLEKLQKAEKYNVSDNRFIPKFEYQSMDNPNLIKIRQELKLDSIAGTGNEISQILNILHWVHISIKHDGTSDKPNVKNALNLINICKTENRGVNCRMMAIILNECYLSMGIKSRYVTCMPKEIEFDECHVINMVFSNDLNKWIWIDPTFDAYLMDETGELLGIGEVRERLIKGKILILNPTANWNREVSQTKEEYLEKYMAKNLYRFETPLISEYNSETWKTGKEITYVELVPLDGIDQLPQKIEETNSITGVKFIQYKTNNPNLFWSKP